MNKIYQEIIQKYGPPSIRDEFNPKESDDLDHILPKEVSEFCINMGRSLLRGGLLQTCHPQDVRGVLALIFGADKDFSHNKCFAFAYSAFGMIFFWMKDYGYGNINVYEGRVTQKNFTKSQPAGILATNAVSVPFWMSDQSLDFVDESGKPLFKKAKAKLGNLDLGECYGFVPTLALGGSTQLDNLRRLKAPEHFAIVAQTMEYDLIDVQGYGQSTIVRPIGPR